MVDCSFPGAASKPSAEATFDNPSLCYQDPGRLKRYTDRAVGQAGRVEVVDHQASGDWRPLVMKQKTRSERKRVAPKAILRLPDLEVAKSAVLNSLSCPDAQRGYRHAIDEFVDWYCSEPRLSFSKTVPAHQLY